MKDMMGMMKQAREMQQKMEEAQEQLDHIEAEGVSGGGAVRVTLSGKGEARRVKIDPELMNRDEVEILEDLLIAAFNDGKAKAEEEAQRTMQNAMGGIGGGGMGGLASLFGGGKGPF